MFWQELGANRIFWTVVLAWAVAQSLKILLGIIREQRFDFRWLFVTGGMPSTHVAGVTALSVSVGRYTGFDSILFAACAVFTLIVLFDAQGVRRITGLLAKTANRLIEDLYAHRDWHAEEARMERIKELSGHTLLQVLGGALVGALVALLADGA